MEHNQIYHIGIIDDQLNEMFLIQRYISEDSSLQIVFSTSDPIQGLDLLEKNEVDILILDMKMHPLNGVQLLQALRVMPQVIVCSNYPEYVYETSPYQAAYIKKTIGRVAFHETMSAVKNRIEFPEQSLELDDMMLDIKTKKSAGYHIRVNTERLMFAMIDDRTMIFCKDNGNQDEKETYLTKEGSITMNDLEKILDQDQFVRVHRSYLVNMAYVEHFTAKFIIIRGAENTVPIGQTFREHFEASMEKYRKANRC